MNAISPQRLAAGFIAAAIAIILGHQLVIFLLQLSGQITPPAGAGAYSLASFGPLGVPRVVSQMFWGGLWGVVMALAWDRFPANWPDWLRGIAVALVGALLVGSWIVVPLIKGGALMANYVPAAWLRGVLIYTVWGAIMGFLYPRIAAMFGAPVAQAGWFSR